MPSTRVTRLRELQVEDRAALDDLIDATLIGHVGLVVDGGPVVVPTAIAREGDTLFAHGSTGSKWMRAVSLGPPACVAVTSVDGVIVARSTFESSLRYRSAVVFGRFRRLEGPDKARSTGSPTSSSRDAERRSASRRSPSSTGPWCSRCRSRRGR